MTDDAVNQEPQTQGQDQTNDPILAKNKELLGEVKNAKQKARELEAKLAEYEAAQKERDDQKARERGDFEKLEGSYKSQIEQLTKQINDNAINNDLQKALNSANIVPHLRSFVADALSKRGITLQDGKAMIGETSLVDYVSQWSQSDEGKHFVAAPQSAGGGAIGGSAAKKSFNELSESERVALYRANPAQYATLANNR